MATSLFEGLDQGSQQSLTLARAYWRRGEYIRARETCDKIQNKPTAAYVEETRVMLEQGDNVAAALATKEALASIPDSESPILVSTLRLHSIIARNRSGEYTSQTAVVADHVTELKGLQQLVNGLDLQDMGESTVILINAYHQAIQSMHFVLGTNIEQLVLDESVVRDLEMLHHDTLEEGYNRLLLVAQLLQERGRITEALDTLRTITSTHQINTDLPGRLDIGRRLHALCRLPNITKTELGLAFLLIGRIVRLDNTAAGPCLSSSEMADVTFTSALDILGEAEHQLGAAEAALELGIKGNSWNDKILNVFEVMDSPSDLLKTYRLLAKHYKTLDNADNQREALVKMATLWPRTGATITERVLHFADLTSTVDKVGSDTATIIETGNALVLRLQQHPMTPFVSGLQLVTYTSLLNALEQAGDWVRAAERTMQAIEILEHLGQAALLLKFRSQYARRERLAITKRPLADRRLHRQRLADLLSTWLEDETYQADAEYRADLDAIRAINDELLPSEANTQDRSTPQIAEAAGAQQRQLLNLSLGGSLEERIRQATQGAHDLAQSSLKDDHGYVGLAYAVVGALYRTYYQEKWQLGRPSIDEATLTIIFNQAIAALEKAAEELSIACDLQLELICHGILAEMWFIRLQSSDQRRNVYANSQIILRHVRRAEVLRDLIRSEFSSFADIEALRNRHLYLMLDQFAGYADIYPLAWHTLWHIGDSTEGWWWVQRSKAQTLLDILGTKLKVPQTLTEGLSASARTLLTREAHLREQIRSQPPEIRIGLRLELKKVGEEIRSSRELDAVQGFRNGRTLGLWDLCEFYEKSSLPKRLQQQHPIVLVDWVVHDQYIFIALAKVGGDAPLIERIDLTYDDVEQWCRDHLGLGMGSGRRRRRRLRDEDPLRELDELVKYIDTFAAPGELLVFAPSQALRCIPLHALSLSNDETIILERNPIVYTTSQSVFQYSLDRAMSSLDCEDEAAFFCTFGADDPIRSTIETITRRIGTEALFDADVTRDNFANRASQATQITFFGHTTDAPAMENRVLQLHNASLSLEDVFDIPLNSAPHVMLVACDSTAQEYGPGGEPQGLIAVLNCAGASSVVGTLWPVQSSHGRAFVERFYSDTHHVELMMRDDDAPSIGEATVTDLACTLQNVTLSMREDFGNEGPYAWAPYILHGSWFSKRSRKT